MGKIESGLFKMIAIGLGKFAGAQHYHTYAYKLGLENTIRAIGRTVLESGKILGGLAILEDANHNTAKLEAVPVEGMEQREEELLALAKSWMGRIPMDLDILILDEIGKNISGAGMDTKVVNRSVLGDYNPWPDTPRIERIFVRDLSDLTYNNAVGRRHGRRGHRPAGEPHRLGAHAGEFADRLHALRHPHADPLSRPTASAWKPSRPRSASSIAREVTIGWIRNTLELSQLGHERKPACRDRAQPHARNRFAARARSNSMPPATWCLWPARRNPRTTPRHWYRRNSKNTRSPVYPSSALAALILESMGCLEAAGPNRR